MEKELQEKLNDLQRQNDELNAKVQEIEDIKKRLEETERLAKNHRHQGTDSVALELLLKNTPYIDGKEFRALGTTGATGTYTPIGGNDNPAKTFVIKNGLVISIT
jgi:hypothetical protein